METVLNAFPLSLDELSVPKTGRAEIQKLSTRHSEIIRLRHLGFTQVEIAERLGISAQTVSNVLSSQIAKDRLAEMALASDAEALDIKARIASLQQPAVELLGQVIMGTVDATTNTRIKVAQDILDRGGNSRVQRVEGNMTGAYMLRVGVEQIKERARQCGYLQDEECQE